MLRISQALSLPPDFVTQTGAIIAKKRRGKTYTMNVLAEEMVKAKLPFVILDPTGASWGLRASADGKRPGFPVTIIGGEHGDVPLERGAGAVIADLVVDHPGFYILDLSLLDSNAAQDQFATDFAERLYRRKATARFPMMLFVDEADAFIPQQPMPGQQRMLGAYDTLVRRGGIRGIGTTLITQRPAVTNKNVLSQVEVLVVLQVVGAADQEAVERWVKAHDTKGHVKEMMTSLASLALGEAWVWSPSWLNIFKRVQVRQRETFNSSKTPEVGDKLVEPKVLAAVDLEAVRERVAATIEKAKADDPKALRTRIAELERAAKHVPSPDHTHKECGRVVEKRVEVAVLGKGDAARLERAAGQLAAAAIKLHNASEDVQKLGSAILEAMRVAKTAAAAPQEKGPLRTVVNAQPSHAHRIATAAAAAAPRNSNGSLGPSHQRVINALDWLAGLGVAQPQRAQIAVLAGMTPNSGYYERVVGELKTSGLVVYPAPGLLALTSDGQGKAQTSGMPKTNEDVHADALRRLGPSHQRVLTCLLNSYPDAKLRDDVAEFAAMTPGSGYYERVVGELKTLGFVTYPRPGYLRAADILFPMAAA